MKKEKMKQNANPVGATSSRPHFVGKTQTEKQNGITLIALIITIIVMLILVGVTVTVALNGGLFRTAKDAQTKTQTERDKELALDSKRVKVNEVWYDSMEDYIAGRESENQEDIGESSGGGSEETVATGEPIGSTDALKAKQVKVGDLVYVANSDGETATVYGYKGDIDYTNSMVDAVIIESKEIQIAKKVEINGKEYTVSTIGKCAFYGMAGAATELESVIIPNTVTTIRELAFNNCTSLQQVTIPSSVTTVENYILSGCIALTKINVSWAEGNKPEEWADYWNGSSVTPTYSYNPQS